MTVLPASRSAQLPEPEPVVRRRVLVVDDSRVQRRILQASLTRWGYSVDEAGSGTEAIELARQIDYDFVLSDWMMPGMNGLDLCRAFRALPRESYGYFILLTANDEKAQVAQGLEVGADDFVSKPVNGTELHARLRAGERILRMERELTEKNRLVSRTLDEISELYAALDRDLIEARKLQMTLVRERQRDFGSAEISVTLRPSGHIGGDLVGFFPLGPDRLAFYAIDVSGHGVASAMLAARLAGMFTAAAPNGSIVWSPDSWQAATPLSPDEAAAQLNRLVLDHIQVDQYLTCVLADADLATGRITLVQAGHPHPLILRRGGSVERIGAGGLPVGLVADAVYDRIEVQLDPGDRLLLMSDGLTEAADEEGTELGEDGVARMVERNLSLRGASLLEALVWDVQAFVGDREVGDDISAVLYEFRGRPE